VGVVVCVCGGGGLELMGWYAWVFLLRLKDTIPANAALNGLEQRFNLLQCGASLSDPDPMLQVVWRRGGWVGGWGGGGQRPGR
jgi:hypothetical protein